MNLVLFDRKLVYNLEKNYMIQLEIKDTFLLLKKPDSNYLAKKPYLVTTKVFNQTQKGLLTKP